MNETLTNLISRKSCADFDGEHILQEELDEIVAAGLNAPSGMNAQDPLLIVVKDDKTVAKLSALNAKAARVTLSKVNPQAAENFPDDPFYGAKDVIAVVAKKGPTSVYDGSLVMGNLMNAAWSMGIDSRWIHRCKEVFDSDDGKALLAKAGITDEVEGIGFCILGHAKSEKEKTQIKPDRVFYI
ncbi:MAG: nitroreductase family protein [Clostridiales bacterium]|nr:nitroreductase family protein [Clostridiales bacterium]